jgi:hypothetical protein
MQLAEQLLKPVGTEFILLPLLELARLPQMAEET